MDEGSGCVGVCGVCVDEGSGWVRMRVEKLLWCDVVKAVPHGLYGVPHGLHGVPHGLHGVPQGLLGVPQACLVCHMACMVCHSCAFTMLHDYVTA